MGKLLDGFNGPIKGKVGNIVGSSWRGIYYIKARPKKRESPPSENEKKNRHEFALAVQWLKPLVEYLRVGFHNYSVKAQGSAAALSLIYKRGLIRDGYHSRIVPAEVLVSYGNLPLSNGLQMAFMQEHSQIHVSWDTTLPKAEEGQTDASDEDQVMVIAYNVETREVKGRLYGAPRFIASQQIDLPAEGPACYHVYAAFVSADRESRSMSQYLGEVNID